MFLESLLEKHKLNPLSSELLPTLRSRQFITRSSIPSFRDTPLPPKVTTTPQGPPPTIDIDTPESFLCNPQSDLTFDPLQNMEHFGSIGNFDPGPSAVDSSSSGPSWKRKKPSNSNYSYVPNVASLDVTQLLDIRIKTEDDW